jgi:hypothetical protein
LYGFSPSLNSHYATALIRAPRKCPCSRRPLFATTCHLAPYDALPARSGSATASVRAAPLAPHGAPPPDAPDRTAQASTSVEDAILLALIDNAREVAAPRRALTPNRGRPNRGRPDRGRRSWPHAAPPRSPPRARRDEN